MEERIGDKYPFVCANGKTTFKFGNGGAEDFYLNAKFIYLVLIPIL